MNPQSLRDPRADKAVVDPLETLWAKYQKLDAADKAACDAFSKAEGEYFASKPSGLTDEEDRTARAKAGLPALEKAVAASSPRANAALRKITNARATSLEGVMVKLRAVAEWNRDEPSDPVIEGVRTALRDFERLTLPAGPDDPFPAWLTEWEAAWAIDNSNFTDKQASEFNDRTLIPLQDKIIDTPTRTIAGVVTKLRMMVHFNKELGSHPPDNLVATALAGAEHVMAGPGVAMEGKAVAMPDPAVELARDHRAATDRHNEASGDDARELLMDVIAPLEEKLARTRPTTREGVIAALDVAAREERRHHCEPPSGTEAMIIGVIENARDALKAGVGMAEDAGPDPLVAMWSEWDKLRKTRFSDHVPHGDPIDHKAEEAFYAGKGDEMTEIEDRIMAAVPSTLAGALVQMSVLIDRTTTDIAPPQKDVDATVAGLAAAQGGAS